MRTLEDSQGELSSESKVKAEMLNDFFSTVFTIKKTKKDTPVLNAHLRSNDPSLKCQREHVHCTVCILLLLLRYRSDVVKISRMT